MDRHINYSMQINWLKAIACIGVCAHHFVLAFYNGISTGNFLSGNGGDVERILSIPPFYALMNGTFYVYVFWTISGYLTTRKMILNGTGADLFKTLLNKYFTIVPYVFVVNVVIYMALMLGGDINDKVAKISGSNWLDGQLGAINSSIPSLLSGTFYQPWFTGTSPYNSALWTMKTELFGTFF